MTNPLISSPAVTAGEPNLPTSRKPKLNTKKSGFQKTTVGPKIKTKPKGKPKAPKTNGGTKAAPKAPAIDATTKSLIDAAVRLKFGGQEQAYGQQLQGAQRFASGVPGWYQQAIGQIKGLQSPVAPVQAPMPTGDPAADSRANLNSAFSQQQAQRQGASNDFLSAVQGGLVAQQGNVLNQNAQQQNQIRQNQTQLAGQKGDFRLSIKSDLDNAKAKADQAAQEFEFKKQVAINADLLKQGQLDVTNRLADSLVGDRKADNRRDQSRIKNERVKIRAKRKQDSINNALKVNDLALKGYKLAHPDAGKGGGSNSTYSKSKVQGFREKWDYAEATAHQLLHKKTYTDKATGTPKRITSDVAYGALLGATKDPDISRAAADLAFGKPVDAKLRHRLAVKGVHLPKSTKGKNIGDIVTGVLKNLGSGS